MRFPSYFLINQERYFVPAVMFSVGFHGSETPRSWAVPGMSCIRPIAPLEDLAMWIVARLHLDDTLDERRAYTLPPGNNVNDIVILRLGVFLGGILRLCILWILGILILSRFLLGIELPIGPHGAIAEMHRAVRPAPHEDIGLAWARPHKNARNSTK